jgi:Spy/CpxP family protein refolding chaperone
MKRFTFSVVITAVLGLAAYSLADAQAALRGPAFGGPGLFQDEQRPAGPRRGFGPGRGGPMPGLRGIELTEEQKEQIRAIHEEVRNANASPAGSAANVEPGDGRPRRGPRGEAPDAALRRQLEAELFADAPDAQRIATLEQQLVAAHATQLARHVSLQQRIAQVLTAEQRAQVRERLSEGRSPGGRRP